MDYLDTDLLIDTFKALWPLWIILVLSSIASILKAKIKGFLGEKATSRKLWRLNPRKYRVINDVMLSVNGRTTQIDHIVISNFGIFVIEIKNYKGLIIGNEKSAYWTQILFKRKEKLYNPIRQNYGHVQALKSVTEDYPGILFIPIVVFSVNADLKIEAQYSDVVYSTKLLKTIRTYEEEVISDEVRDEIYSRIVSLNIKDKKLKKNHVSIIRQTKRESSKTVKKGICPKCRGRLIDRRGRHGRFRGCSNFPRCRFTA